MDKLTYDAGELAKVLGISKSKAYDLMHREDFPTLRIGKRLLVVRSKFEVWLEEQSGNYIVCQ